MKMTNRERFINCALCLDIDRTPLYFMFGPWGETVARWQSEGIADAGGAWLNNFPLDQVTQIAGYVNHLHCPGFAYEVLQRHADGICVCRDGFGQTIECIQGHSSIPKILHSPVNNFDEWEQLKKERLNPDDPRRFPPNWKDIAAAVNAKDQPVQIGTYPCGLYGTLRDLMGVEGSLFAFYDQPELVHEIMDYLTTFYLRIYEKICADVKVDIIHIWEDMSGKGGSLISPAFVKEFMLPNYRRIRDFAGEHKIPVIQLDTDGNCEELIPMFGESGINMMLPFEVASGCDVVKWRKKYPYMSMLGGIDKIEIARGKVSIDREIERIEPLIGKTGYFPALDHLIPPEISYADYAYFTNRLADIIGINIK